MKTCVVFSIYVLLLASAAFAQDEPSSNFTTTTKDAALKKSRDQPHESRARPANFTGVWVTRHANGKKFYESEFVNGKPHGLSTLWDEKGNRIRQGFHVNGKAHGAWSWWKPSGQLWFIRIDENGETIREVHYEGLCVVADGQYKKGHPWQGTFRDWHYRNGDKVVYHEIQHGQPWNGQFRIPLDGPGPTASRRTPRRLATFRDGKQIPEK